MHVILDYVVDQKFVAIEHSRINWMPPRR